MTTYDTQAPYIASYVILEKDGKYAFLLRRNTGWMDGHYTLPAGKVEHDEAFSACAIREAKEEAGVTIDTHDLQHVLTMHRYAADGNNWVDVFFVAHKWHDAPYNTEPEKAERLDWLDPQDLPDNMVPNQYFAFDQIRKGYKFCEFDWDKKDVTNKGNL